MITSIRKSSGHSRRTFLRTAGTMAGAVALAPLRPVFGANALEGRIMTVLGPISVDQLGVTLSHEQGVVDFLGAEKVKGLRRDAEDAFTTILPHLKKFKEHGG